ncbi:MAG: hypothetical protein JNJ83_01850 [Verrucomicrobiaceae bacterium]|nr:hypothetical protein [Verrucomicrobiaceae bacterium]
MSLPCLRLSTAHRLLQPALLVAVAILTDIANAESPPRPLDTFSFDTWDTPYHKITPISTGGYIAFTSGHTWPLRQLHFSAAGNSWTPVPCEPIYDQPESRDGYQVAQGGGRIVVLGARRDSLGYPGPFTRGTYTSMDGLNWTFSPSGNLVGLCYNDGHFYSYRDGYLVKSVDGLTWTEVFMKHLQRLTFGNGVWITWNDWYGQPASLSYSGNGVNWRSADVIGAFGNIQLEGVSFLGGRFFGWMGQIDGPYAYATSNDGSQWNVVTPPVQGVSGYFRRIHWHRGQYVALLTDWDSGHRPDPHGQSRLFTSKDLVNWTPQRAVLPYYMTNLDTAPDSGELIVWGIDTSTLPARTTLATSLPPTSPPVLIRQPTSPLRITPGSLTNLSVEVDGSGLSFQWYLGLPGDTSQPISKATDSTFSGATALLGPRSYWVRVSNELGHVDSDAVTISPTFETRIQAGFAWVQSNSRVAHIWTHEPGTLGTRIPGASYQWLKGDEPLVGETGTAVARPEVTLSDAGVYILEVRIRDEVERLGPVAFIVLDGSPNDFFSLEAGSNRPISFFTPHGFEVDYEWLKGSPPQRLMDETGELAGTRTNTLTFGNFGVDDEDVYHLKIYSRLDRSEYQHSAFVRIGTPPVINGWDGLPTLLQGAEVCFTFHSDSEVTSWEVSGLPPGMVFDQAAWAVCGAPTRPGTYIIRVRAINPFGESECLEKKMVVVKRPPHQAGHYAGLVGRLPGDDPGFGGALVFDVTAQGGVSGSIDIGSKRYRFHGKLKREGRDSSPCIDFVFYYEMIRLRLDWEDAISNVFRGNVSLTDSDWSLPVMALWTPPTSSRWVVKPWYGTHHLTIRDGESEAPGVLFVSRRGWYSFAGHLPDNTRFTMAGRISHDGSLSARTLLVGRTGSLQGWNFLLGNGELFGNLELWKRPTPGRPKHPEGIPLRELQVVDRAAMD